MRKMSTGVAVLFLAGLLGLACTDKSGLTPLGGSGGNAGGAKGGQAGSVVGRGTAGGSGGTIGAGGVGAGGTSVTGGATGNGGTTGTGGCPLIACPAIACLYGSLPNPDPCGCSLCAPPPDAGVAKDGGATDGPRICPPVACPAIGCVGGTQPNPDPCGCPICAPTPDAGIAKDACLALPCAMPLCPGGSYVPSPDPCGCPVCATDAGTATDAGKKDAPICSPINCPMLACKGGYVPSPDPCGCPTCGPLDAGVARDAGRADSTPICLPVACPAIACVGGTHPNPDPCGCPLCGPIPDAGVAKDATPPTACPMLTKLNSTDAAQVGYSAARGLFECQAGGATEICVSNDAAGCSGSAVGSSVVCSNLCAANQYGLGYGGVGPLAPPPSIDLPAGCGTAMFTPGGTEFYCCPCGT